VSLQNNEQRTDDQVEVLVFRWLEHGVLSIVPRRDRALQRSKDGRRPTDSKDQSWVVTIECAIIKELQAK
jgi:hypothetical protein